MSKKNLRRTCDYSSFRLFKGKFIMSRLFFARSSRPSQLSFFLDFSCLLRHFLIFYFDHFLYGMALSIYRMTARSDFSLLLKTISDCSDVGSVHVFSKFFCKFFRNFVQCQFRSLKIIKVLYKAMFFHLFLARNDDISFFSSSDKKTFGFLSIVNGLSSTGSSSSKNLQCVFLLFLNFVFSHFCKSCLTE